MSAGGGGVRKYLNINTFALLVAAFFAPFAWSLDQEKPFFPPVEDSGRVLEPRRVTAEEFRIHLGLVREALVRDDVRKFLNEVFKDYLQPIPKPIFAGETEEPGKPAPPSEVVVIPELLETQLLLFLRENPQSVQILSTYLGKVRKMEEVPEAKRDAQWQQRRKELGEEAKEQVKDYMKDPKVLEIFQKLNDPVEPYWAEAFDGGPSWQSLQLHVSHNYTVGDRVVPADDLSKKMIEFVLGARMELQANFYEFDLPGLTDALISISKRGVKTRIGIDKKVVAANEHVAEQVKRLRAAGVELVEVDAVGLNHQKMMARDPELPSNAAVLFSSANATVSDSDARGDLFHLPDEKRPKESIPNANHLVVVHGQLISLVLQHQLEKTLNPRFLLRGSEFPLSGAFQFRGPIDPKTAKNKEIILAFTPGGGLKEVNKLIIARVIQHTTGPVHMAQFAFSSNTVGEALIKRIAAELERGLDPELYLVGETPFAMQYWSQLLKLSGLKLVEHKDGKKEYIEDPDAPIRRVLSGEKLEKFRSAIKVAPEMYSQKWHKIDGQDWETVAKLHHKVLISGIASILGTSFNFSTGAETNSEQILVILDSELAELGRAMVMALWNLSQRSVVQVAMERNRRGGFDASIDPDVDRRKQTPLPGPKVDSVGAQKNTVGAPTVEERRNGHPSAIRECQYPLDRSPVPRSR